MPADPPLLLDSGVWIASRDEEDPFHSAAVALVESAADGRPTAALDLTLYEVANVAAVRWRAPEEAGWLVELVSTVSGDRLIRIDAHLAAAAIALATENDLTVYDAAYVACARRLGWSLVSTDLKDLVRPGFARAPDQAVG